MLLLTSTEEEELLLLRTLLARVLVSVSNPLSSTNPWCVFPTTGRRAPWGISVVEITPAVSAQATHLSDGVFPPEWSACSFHWEEGSSDRRPTSFLPRRSSVFGLVGWVVELSR